MSHPTTDALTIRRVSLDSLHQDPANARSHDAANMAAIEASLERFGQAEPLVVQESSGRVIGGNGRLAAMRKLNWTECDVVELDVDDLQATALGIALNRTGELASWDDSTLARLLDELRSEDALDGVGFNTDELDELLDQLSADLEPKDLDDPGPGAPPDEPVSRPGDLWVLGEHRLLCGDSTSEDDMARLMGDETAALLATDPPYLVDYDGSRGQDPPPRGEAQESHWDAFVDAGTSVEFFQTFLRVALARCIERVPVYQWHASRRQALVEKAWEANGLLLHQTIIWVKTRGILTRSHYLWQHEPCFYGWPKSMMPTKPRRPPTNERTVWEIDQAGENRHADHPTSKPLPIFERPIEYHTRPGEVVLEPFSGSGSQIIAAERLGRKCFAMELSPAFVDVAVRRWQIATGGTAVLDGTEQTFSDVEAERRSQPTAVSEGDGSDGRTDNGKGAAKEADAT